MVILTMRTHGPTWSKRCYWPCTFARRKAPSRHATCCRQKLLSTCLIARAKKCVSITLSKIRLHYQ